LFTNRSTETRREEDRTGNEEGDESGDGRIAAEARGRGDGAVDRWRLEEGEQKSQSPELRPRHSFASSPPSLRRHQRKLEKTEMLLSSPNRENFLIPRTRNTKTPDSRLQTADLPAENQHPIDSVGMMFNSILFVIIDPVAAFDRRMVRNFGIGIIRRCADPALIESIDSMLIELTVD
jgi:hypothetical protein